MVRKLPSDPSSVAAFRVCGLDCVEEVKLIRRRLDGEPGVERLSFDVLNGKMTADFDATTISAEKIASAVSGIGLECTLWHDRSDDSPWWSRHGREAATLTSGLALVAGMLAQAVETGEVFAILSHDHAGGLSLTAVALFAVAILSGAWFIAPKGLRALAALRPDMNALVLISIVGACVLGEWAEGATLAFLFALAGRIESWSMQRARREVGGLIAIAPQEASVVHGDHEHKVAIDRVSVGATVRVRPGESIPCDGEVLQGSSGVNESMLTGEAVPNWKGPGDAVYAGSFNGDGTLDIRTTKEVADTRLARIVRMIEESQHRRAPSERFVDRFARYYTPAMFLAAALVIIVPPLAVGGAWDYWFYQGMLLLLISCPCALVISTPVSIAAAVASAARKGILIKGGAHLEEASRLRAIAFDKTGVLTEGEPEVTKIQAYGGRTEDEVLELLAGLELYSEHPLARAVVEYAQRRGVTPGHAAGFQAMQGKGASAEVDGREFWVGNVRMLEERSDDPKELTRRLAEFDDGRSTVVVCGSGGETWALVGLSDPVRAEAVESLAELRRLGIEKLTMLTGDNRSTAAVVADQVGVDEVKAELLPEDKTAALHDLLVEHRHVAMVGDGVNDAQAIARASLGIGLGRRGSDIALETADVIFMTPRLDLLPALMRHSRRALAVIKQNVAIALLFKAAFVIAAVYGIATLWMAVVADMGATLLVVFNGLRMLSGGRALAGPRFHAVKSAPAASTP